MRQERTPGDRVATATSGSFGYLLPDLHGNAAAAFNAAGTAISDAFAYDAWGALVAAVTSALPTPWRYQGRMLESAPGTPALYDFGARSYNPAIGAFISLDSVHGSAQNPALLNGYLYANANPATLIDPDGHSATTDAAWRAMNGISGADPGNGSSSPSANCGSAPSGSQGQCESTRVALSQAAVGSTAALAAGCPVQYCGSADQKEHSTTLDTATRATMQYVALTKFAAAAQAEAARPYMTAAPQGRPDCHGNWFCDLNNAIGTYGDTLCEYRVQGTKCITDPDFLVPVVLVALVVAGSVVVCNAAFEACAALVAKAVQGGGTVCKESDQSCREIATGAGDAMAGGVDTIVLGRYPQYLKTASEIGGRTFNVPSWTWPQNQSFLDDAIARHSRIVLSNVPFITDEETTFDLEVQYLQSKGYTFAANGAEMVPSGR